MDGLPYEFYRAVWSVISEEFLKILHCQLDRSKLIDSDTMGASRLASKVSGIPQVDEVRPIILLNTDYKILIKIFVFRMMIYTAILDSGY